MHTPSEAINALKLWLKLTKTIRLISFTETEGRGSTKDNDVVVALDHFRDIHIYIRYIEGIQSLYIAVNRPWVHYLSIVSHCHFLAMSLTRYKSHHHDKVKARIHFILIPDTTPYHTITLEGVGTVVGFSVGFSLGSSCRM